MIKHLGLVALLAMVSCGKKDDEPQVTPTVEQSYDQMTYGELVTAGDEQADIMDAARKNACYEETFQCQQLLSIYLNEVKRMVVLSKVARSKSTTSLDHEDWSNIIKGLEETSSRLSKQLKEIDTSIVENKDDFIFRIGSALRDIDEVPGCDTKKAVCSRFSLSNYKSEKEMYEDISKVHNNLVEIADLFNKPLHPAYLNESRPFGFYDIDVNVYVTNMMTWKDRFEQTHFDALEKPIDKIIELETAFLDSLVEAGVLVEEPELVYPKIVSGYQMNLKTHWLIKTSYLGTVMIKTFKEELIPNTDKLVNFLQSKSEGKKLNKIKYVEGSRYSTTKIKGSFWNSSSRYIEIPLQNIDWELE